MIKSSEFYKQKTFSIVQELFLDFDRVALSTATDNQLVHLKYRSLGDLSTLQQCSELSHRYLQLQDQDIVITNDPYSGGTILSAPTLILGVNPKGGKAEFLIASRLTLPLNAGAHKTVDEEGLRIPPSPLVMAGKVNAAIFEALKSHPAMTQEFIRAIEQEIDRLLELREKMLDALSVGGLDLSKASLKNYLKSTYDRLKAKIDDLPSGETLIEDEINKGEFLKLRLEIQDGSILFDYAGTSTGLKVFMTENAVFGASVAAILSRFNENIPVNSGSLSCFHVSAPRGCLVNASFPRSVQLGHTDGLNAVASTVLEALSKIDKKYPFARSGLSHMMYELDFGGGNKLFDTLGVGLGAQFDRIGLSGAYYWQNFNNFLSLEQLEQKFPVQLVSTGFRTNSGGDGKQRGGDGAARTLRLRAPAELKWQYLSPARKSEGVAGGKSALIAEMMLKKADGSESVLPSEGKINLAAGDTLVVLAPGGGGFGDPA